MQPNTETATDGKKPRKAPAPRIPDGFKQVKFLLKDDEYAKLAHAAEEEDRLVDDFCRVLARKAAKAAPTPPMKAAAGR